MTEIKKSGIKLIDDSDLVLRYDTVRILGTTGELDAGVENAKPFYDLDEEGNLLSATNSEDVQTSSPSFRLDYRPELDIVNFGEENNNTFGVNVNLGFQIFPGGRRAVQNTVPVTIQNLDDFLGTTSPSTTLETYSGENRTSHVDVNVGLGVYLDTYFGARVGIEGGLTSGQFYGNAQMALAEQRRPGQYSPNGSSTQATEGQTSLISKFGPHLGGNIAYNLGHLWAPLNGLSPTITYQHTFGSMSGINSGSSTTNPRSYGGFGEDQIGFGLSIAIESVVDSITEDAPAPISASDATIQINARIATMKCPEGLTASVGNSTQIGGTPLPSAADILGSGASGLTYTLSITGESEDESEGDALEHPSEGRYLGLMDVCEVIEEPAADATEGDAAATETAGDAEE